MTNLPPSPDQSDGDIDDDLTFEVALDQLEKIVAQLERGQPALATALTDYERGLRLLNHCHSMLDRAERTVAILTGVDDAGEPRTAPFDSTATDKRKTS